MSACEKCKADAITTAGDSSDYGASLCGPCGRAWLLEVLNDWDASLALFTGNATPEQQQQHADRLASEHHAEAERAFQAARRKAEADARAAGRRSQAEQDGEERARSVLAIVQERPRPTLEIATALGISGRTAGRYVALAKRKGYVRPRGRDIEPAERTQQPQAA